MSMLGVIAFVATALAFTVAGVWLVRGRVLNVEDYISARGSAGAGVTAASLFASTLGAWILFSPGEAAARSGVVALAGYAAGSALAVVVFAWLGPRLRALLPAGHALTEFVLHRYGRGMYGLVLAVTAFYLFIYLAAELTGLGFAARAVTGIPAGVAVIAVLAATLIYTAYGGLRASLATDMLQAAAVVPLLLLVPGVLVALAGGLGPVVRNLSARAPGLLAAGSRPGWETALTLVIAIVGANLFNQGYWQRVWVTRDDAVLRRAFGWAGLATVPAILLAGSVGLLAQATGALAHPSAALFDLLGAAAPWLGYAVLILVVTLVMSTTDTLLNALVSLATVDLARIRPGWAGARLLRWSRWLTLVPAVLAGAVALRGYSVLYLFLVADLVCVAAAVPTFAGLFNPRLSGRAALGSALLGIAAGAAWFPDPAFGRGSLLLSFVVAGVVPAALCWVLGRRGAAFDLAALTRRVRGFEA